LRAPATHPEDEKAAKERIAAASKNFVQQKRQISLLRVNFSY
jgi:hypothetical protein